jgi:hypothetical protein
LHIEQRIITMPHELCSMLTVKILRPRYSANGAKRLVGFFIVSIALAYAFMDVLATPGRASWEWIEKPDPCAAKPFDTTVLPAAYRIHR